MCCTVYGTGNIGRSEEGRIIIELLFGKQTVRMRTVSGQTEPSMFRSKIGMSYLFS
jgi:hypothetical protein